MTGLTRMATRFGVLTGTCALALSAGIGTSVAEVTGTATIFGEGSHIFAAIDAATDSRPLVCTLLVESEGVVVDHVSVEDVTLGTPFFVETSLGTQELPAGTYQAWVECNDGDGRSVTLAAETITLTGSTGGSDFLGSIELFFGSIEVLFGS